MSTNNITDIPILNNEVGSVTRPKNISLQNTYFTFCTKLLNT